MVEDTGFEPCRQVYGAKDKAGTGQGQIGPKGGQNEPLTQTAFSGKGQTGTPSGLPEPTSSRQVYAGIMPDSETQSQLPQDLQAVVDSWPSLPEAVKVGIVAMVKAARGTK